jgi:hypothetical protein
MSDWMPIETAPKDGTPIWVTDVGGGMHIAYWHTEWQWKRLSFKRSFQSLWSYVPEGREQGDVLEHFDCKSWQPLPNPPTPDKD